MLLYLHLGNRKHTHLWWQYSQSPQRRRSRWQRQIRFHWGQTGQNHLHQTFLSVWGKTEKATFRTQQQNRTYVGNRDQYSLLLGDIGAVPVVKVVAFLEVPVVNVSLDEAGYDDEAQDHQIDSCEDFVHQRRLAHAEGQETWREQTPQEARKRNSYSGSVTAHPVAWADMFGQTITRQQQSSD